MLGSVFHHPQQVLTHIWLPLGSINEDGLSVAFGVYLGEGVAPVVIELLFIFFTSVNSFF